MRVTKYICDQCEKDCPSPHIVIESFDQARSGWIKKLTKDQLEEMETADGPDEDALERAAREMGRWDNKKDHNWRIVAPMKAIGGVVQFCSSKCLAEYMEKLKEKYQINKLKE